MASRNDFLGKCCRINRLTIDLSNNRFEEFVSDIFFQKNLPFLRRQSLLLFLIVLILEEMRTIIL